MRREPEPRRDNFAPILPSNRSTACDRFWLGVLKKFFGRLDLECFADFDLGNEVSAMMGEPVGPQDRLYHEFDLDEVVPPDHLLRGIDAVLDLSWLREALLPHYNSIGRPSVDPELMILMLLVCHQLIDGFARRLKRLDSGFLMFGHKAAITHHIGGQYRGKLPPGSFFRPCGRPLPETEHGGDYRAQGLNESIEARGPLRVTS
jgi:hypothetical protein